MDKYVTIIPRNKEKDKKTCPSGSKALKQGTIESLKRVVVVDDILRLKSILLLGNQSSKVLLEAITELGKKIPSKEVLLSTKIGHTVNKLRKHEDPEVSQAAKTLFKSWKGFYKEKNDLPQIEVRADLDTEQLRTSARKLLAAPLDMTPDTDVLPDAIERETFHQHGRRIKASYRRHIRKLVFTLKHHHEYGVKLKSGELSVKDFVANFKKL